MEAEVQSVDHCGNSCACGLHGGARHLHCERRAAAHCRQPRRQFRPRNLGADQLSHIERHRSSSGSVGRQRFFLTCIAIFTVSSFLCGISFSLPMLLICRVVQGAGGGGLQPMAQAIMADSFDEKKRGQAFALYALVTVLAPSIGPTVGGWITDNYSWRWIFYINIPVGILATVLVMRFVEDPPWIKATLANFRKLDYIGLGLLTVAMGGMQIMLDKGEENDWLASNFIRIFALLFAT